MSFIKRMGEKRLWIGILLTMAVTIAVNMLGAIIFCKGWLSPAYEQMWMLLGWFLGAFFGCRHVLADGRGNALCWAGATTGTVYALIWIVSLMVPHDIDHGKNWWQVLIALAAGAMLSVLIRPGLKRGKRRNTNRRAKTKRR